MSIINKPPEMVKREYELQEPIAVAVEKYATFIQSTPDHVVNSALKIVIWRDVAGASNSKHKPTERMSLPRQKRRGAEPISLRGPGRGHVLVVGGQVPAGGSTVSALRNSSTSRWLDCSGSDTSESAYEPSESSTSRRRFRYSDRNRFRKIVNSQADILVPGSNDLRFAQARNNVSCTKSSARSTLPQSEMANARRLGTAASMTSRTLLFGL